MSQVYGCSECKEDGRILSPQYKEVFCKHRAPEAIKTEIFTLLHFNAYKN